MNKNSLALLGVLIAAVSVIIAGAFAYRVYAASYDVYDPAKEATQAPDVNKNWEQTFPAYLHQDKAEKTCGAMPANNDIQHYYFGFKRGDGFCAAQGFLANNSNEAWTCARQYCQTCQIEDMTSLMKTSITGGELTPLDRYCPTK